MALGRFLAPSVVHQFPNISLRKLTLMMMRRVDEGAAKTSHFGAEQGRGNFTIAIFSFSLSDMIGNREPSIISTHWPVITANYLAAIIPSGY